MAIVRTQFRFERLADGVSVWGNVRRLPHTPETAALLRSKPMAASEVRQLVRAARPDRKYFTNHAPLGDSLYSTALAISGHVLSDLQANPQMQLLRSHMRISERPHDHDVRTVRFTMIHQEGRADRRPSASHSTRSQQPRNPRSTTASPRIGILDRNAARFTELIAAPLTLHAPDAFAALHTHCYGLSPTPDKGRFRTTGASMSALCRRAHRAAWHLLSTGSHSVADFQRTVLTHTYNKTWIKTHQPKDRSARPRWIQNRLIELYRKDPERPRALALAEAHERATGMSLPNLDSTSGAAINRICWALGESMRVASPHTNNPLSNDPRFLTILQTDDLAGRVLDLMPQGAPQYFGSQRKPRKRSEHLRFLADIATRTRKLSGMGMNMLLSCSMLDPLMEQSLSDHRTILMASARITTWRDAPKFPHSVFLDSGLFG